MNFDDLIPDFGNSRGGYGSYGRSRSIRNRLRLFLIGTGVAVAVLLGVIAYGSYSQVNTASGVTICGKESVTTEDGHEYRVYTTNGTYVVADRIVNGASFRSADIYGRIIPGQTYDITSYGWRLPLVSAFENIIKATPSTLPVTSCDTPR